MTATPAPYEKHKLTTDALDTLGTIISPEERRDAIHLAVEPVMAGELLSPGDHVAVRHTPTHSVAYLVEDVEIPDDTLVELDLDVTDPLVRKALKIAGSETPKPVGIVDPFLDDVVQPGQWFWLVVYPRQIHSLRHVWEHPSFRRSELAMASGEPMTVTIPDYDAEWQRADDEKYVRDWLAGTDIGDWVTVDGLVEAATTGYWKSPSREPDDDYGSSLSLDDYGLTSHGRDAYGSIPDELWDRVERLSGTKVVHRVDSLGCSC